MTTAALIVAAGRGARAGGGGPKQYRLLDGRPVLTRTMELFARHPRIDRVLAVIHPEDEAAFEAACPGADYVHGGADRQASVRLGLEALAGDPPDRVLIHDGARPFVGPATIGAVIDALDRHEGALAALPVTDTLKREDGNGAAAATMPRDGLWRAQTPQGFRFATILAAHRSAPSGSATDDASLLEAAGRPVALVPDDPTNIKLTYPGDFALAELLVQRETRTGFGYDVHAFDEGEAVILGGIRIPHTHSLKGHSDADVAMHALTDALYGALSEGDIGRHFPPTDEQWRGAPSDVFLRHAAGLLADRGGRLTSADITLICEAPKIAPHAEAMRESLAQALGCEVSRISVKATTSEGLGFTGRREGIAAQAVCTISVPVS
ncbi:bifunctional 2-C-methyl-D-erythritol 4-phosphate cytidylyltransferase/2-C-methyl-D-erythritol 2,4-cyclodiphosphate synthase [Parvularcula oceani]|uniref:bifunctional 2-C-methyl-D-erythritol 4-phosphate cytidylyltransferase/2-C-methyl-D-erythritol 2,4-cyclodiphosphate synthase n=1 Tax=Parvularcula oceani TaxID=1247963 RepID=UPI0004E13783|nr:bifunctional 2-C-methyl-D-erythritol 4-phosphate cytidylyltransferase/2-C-methyl-D-erythritol 2,4-cyclodiphosphate synthase [Parvularcula oceani]